MAINKPRASDMESKERIPAAIRSVAFTLIAWTAAAGLVAMIGLGALSGCAGDQGEDQNVTGESQSGHDGTENAKSATEEPFTGWTPHAEVGEGEHGGGESGGEHGSSEESRVGEHGEGREGGGEHGDGEGDEGSGEHGSGG